MTENALAKLTFATTALAEARTLDEVKQLPSVSGIYIVFNDSEILYVGKAKNIRKRWSAHHRKQQLDGFGNVRIFSVPTGIYELDFTERYYIGLLKPLLNRTPVPSTPAIIHMPSRHIAPSKSKDAKKFAFQVLRSWFSSGPCSEEFQEFLTQLEGMNYA